MGKSSKSPKPEKNSIQYVKHLLENERKEKESYERKNEQLEKTVENLKKDIAKLTAALEGRFSEEEIKALVVKMVKKRDASLKAKVVELKKVENPCPKCGEEMLRLKKFDGTDLFKCMKCRKKV